ncbi:MAG TPA: hypothetical protein DEP61_05850 [Lachnospiraceae bacterium]|nr:hypothetical protein [Lachnospiraceae bacterium]
MERIQRSEGEWADIIRQCKSSGLSDERWLKENGICPATYYRHLKKFRNVQVGKSVPVPVKPAVPESHEVIPLTIMEEKPVCVDGKDSVAARIHTGGIAIDLYNGADREMISSLLQMVVQLC